MEYKANAKYLRVSTRKMRLVVDAVKKLPVKEAEAQLHALPKHAGKVLAKVLASAVANAKQKNADVSMLKIIRIEVGEGPFMKRWHAASRGMAHAYKKRMTHVLVVLGDKEVKEEKPIVSEVKKPEATNGKEVKPSKVSRNKGKK